MARKTTWTRREDADLRQLWVEEVPVTEIAVHLGRSAGGVHKRREQLRLPGRAKRLSRQEILLMAAAGLPDIFDESDLVVACYNLEPRQFCLRNYPKYADTKIIGVALAQKFGPVRKGLMQRCGPRKLRLTILGRQRVRELRGDG